MIAAVKPFLLLLLALSWAGHALAGEGAETPERFQLREQMRGLMQAFQNLEDPLDKKPPDYDAIIKLLDEMNVRAKNVQSLKPSGHPGKKFKKVFSDLEYFKKSAQAGNSSDVQDAMNRLAESCFRCHLSHN